MVEGSVGQDLNLSHDYMQNVIQSMKGMMIVINPDGNIRMVNRATQKILGYSNGELVGESFNDTVLGLSKADRKEMMSSTVLLSRQLTRDIQQTFYTKGGDEIPVLLSSDLIRDKDDKILGVVCVAHDETQRHKAEHQIRYQAELMKSVSDAIIGTDLNFVINSWNQAANRIYGYSFSQAIGQDLNALLQHEKRDWLSQNQINHVGMSWESEQVHYRSDGSALQILSAISPVFDAQEQHIGWVVVNRDVTDLKLTEAELERLVIQLALLRTIDAELGHSLDMNNVLLFSLRASINLSGAEHGFIVLIDHRGHAEMQTYNMSDEELNAANVLKHPTVAWVREQKVSLHLTDPEQMPEIARGFQPDTCATIALPLIHQQKLIGVIVLETAKADDFDEAMLEFLNMLVARVAVAVTNADLYRISQGQLAELQMVYAQVSKLEQLKTDMIRIASHDLRSPIGLINGYLALLQNDLQDRITEQEGEFLQEIMNASARMDEITHTLLSLERIQQVAEEDYREYFDIVPVVQRAVKNYRRQATANSQKLDYEAAEDLSTAYVQGDSAQINEAINNLISNALKYTPPEGQITVELYAADDQIFFKVIDTGYGIPEEEQKKLFQPFSRAKSEETADIKGTGLGLHLVNNIINRHQGEIIFQSEYQVGSTFGFVLPLLDEEAASNLDQAD